MNFSNYRVRAVIFFLPGIFLLFISLFIVACSNVAVTHKVSLVRHRVDLTDAIEFLVLSDMHGYDDGFITPGSAKVEWVVRKGKKQDMFFANTRRALSETRLRGGVSFVLLAGDLTVDGERTGHESLALILEDFEDSGIPVYVIPGNHDVNSPMARRMIARGNVYVETVSPEQFVSIYADFGYDEAVTRDVETLSYVAEPRPGIVLLALDTNRWYDAMYFPLRLSKETGAIKESTFLWIESILKGAKRAGKTVIVVQHHPLDDTVGVGNPSLPGSQRLSAMYGQYGVALVVSGHKHRFVMDGTAWVPRVVAPNLSTSAENAIIVRFSASEIDVQYLSQPQVADNP